MRAVPGEKLAKVLTVRTEYREVHTEKSEGDILPGQSQASEVNKRFFTWLKTIFIDTRGQQKGLRMNRILTKQLNCILVEKLFPNVV